MEQKGTVNVPVESRKRQRVNTNEDTCEFMNRRLVLGGVYSILSDVIERNRSLSEEIKMPPLVDPALAFYSSKVPSTGLKQYVTRLVRYSECSVSVFVVALVLLDRILRKSCYYRMNKLNVHRLLLTSVFISSKLVEDYPTPLKHLALLGGCSTVELRYLERIMLDALDYNLTVKEDTYEVYEQRLRASYPMENTFRRRKLL